jgi:GMP synthase-like glutamine amidotransferase
LGAAVFANPHKEIGWHAVTLTPEGRKSFLFNNIPEKFLTFHWHADHYTLPPACTRLAYSEPTENQSYISESHPIVGIQFHPEYTLELVRRFTRDWGDEWQEDRYVASKEEVLAQTVNIPETYWLMEALLDNMDHQFGIKT